MRRGIALMAKKPDTLLKPLLKPCTRLILKPDRSAKAQSMTTKFGGLPYLEHTELWPACRSCGNALVFVAQFNLAQCLHECHDHSLYVFYYCMECLPRSSSDIDNGDWLVRRYQNPCQENLKPLTKAAANPEHALPPSIVTCERAFSLPDWEDLNKDSVRNACIALDAHEPWEVYAEAKMRLGCIYDNAHLIGAYPQWIEGTLTRTCPHCGERMEVLIQLDSDDKAKLLWGDMGLIYFFQCRHHPDTFILELQCY
jgi:hypothetical protein